MGREVRRVPATWDHPKHEYTGSFIPLFPGEQYQRDYDYFMKILSDNGLQEALDQCGAAPNKDNYMPNWPEPERTHYMMYEDTSEGTPISPAFPTPEKLARWLADSGASSFGSSTATYEQWLNVARGGWAPSAIYTPETGLISGVEASIEQ